MNTFQKINMAHAATSGKNATQVLKAGADASLPKFDKEDKKSSYHKEEKTKDKDKDSSRKSSVSAYDNYVFMYPDECNDVNAVSNELHFDTKNSAREAARTMILMYLNHREGITDNDINVAISKAREPFNTLNPDVLRKMRDWTPSGGFAFANVSVGNMIFNFKFQKEVSEYCKLSKEEKLSRIDSLSSMDLTAPYNEIFYCYDSDVDVRKKVTTKGMLFCVLVMLGNDSTLAVEAAQQYREYKHGDIDDCSFLSTCARNLLESQSDKHKHKAHGNEEEEMRSYADANDMSYKELYKMVYKCMPSLLKDDDLSKEENAINYWPKYKSLNGI